MGKGSAVGPYLDKQFKGMSKMAEPEESIKNHVAEIVQASCAAAPDQGFVINAGGSQWSDGGTIRGLNLSVRIDLVAFVEEPATT
jgi:hypothetical protein